MQDISKVICMQSSMYFSMFWPANQTRCTICAVLMAGIEIMFRDEACAFRMFGWRNESRGHHTDTKWQLVEISPSTKYVWIMRSQNKKPERNYVWCVERTDRDDYAEVCTLHTVVTEVHQLIVVSKLYEVNCCLLMCN